MLAGGWALGAGACAVVDTLLAAMLVEGMAANGWALDAGAWASAGVLLLADGHGAWLADLIGTLRSLPYTHL